MSILRTLMKIMNNVSNHTPAYCYCYVIGHNVTNVLLYYCESGDRRIVMILLLLKLLLLFIR